MDYVKQIAWITCKWHAEMLDVNRALNILGLRSDEKAESVAKKHVMKCVDIAETVGIDLTKKE